MNHLPRKVRHFPGMVGNVAVRHRTVLKVTRSTVYLRYISESLSTVPEFFMKTVNILPQYINILYYFKTDLVKTIGANIVFALLLCFAKQRQQTKKTRKFRLKNPFKSAIIYISCDIFHPWSFPSWHAPLTFLVLR